MSPLVGPILMPNAFYMELPLTSSKFMLKFKFNKFICTSIKMANKNFSEKRDSRLTLVKLTSQDLKVVTIITSIKKSFFNPVEERFQNIHIWKCMLCLCQTKQSTLLCNVLLCRGRCFAVINILMWLMF